MQYDAKHMNDCQTKPHASIELRLKRNKNDVLKASM